MSSPIGIVAYLSVFNSFFQQKPITEFLSAEERILRNSENERLFVTKKVATKWVIVGLIFLSAIRYMGIINIEDVFNGRHKYVGQTVNFKADGIGKQFTLRDTLIYEGEFKANLYDGSGVYYFCYEKEDGTEDSRLRYEGEFVQGEYSGYGKMYYADETDINRTGIEAPCLMYEGEFQKGLFEGKGIRYYYETRDGVANARFIDDYYLSSTYEGVWVEGNLVGEGIQLEFDEEGNTIERYKGEFKNGVKQGVGIWEFTDASENHYGKVIYHGEVDNGKFGSEGIYYGAGGDTIYYNSSTEQSESSLKMRFPFPKEGL